MIWEIRIEIIVKIVYLLEKNILFSRYVYIIKKYFLNINYRIVLIYDKGLRI